MRLRPYQAPRRQPRINDMLYPPGSRQPGNVWVGGFIMNVPEASSGPAITPSPTPTPSITASPTVTPTVTIGLTPTATETQTPTPTNTPTNTASQTGTPAVTSSPTNTPTQTQTGTPSVTSSPTSTPTNTPSGTPSPTPTAFTGYGYNLVTTPYNPPTSGNTIFPELSVSGATTGLTNPNTFDINGIYWSRIDRTGVDRTSYFSALTATTNYLTFYQGGQSVIYSGSSTAIVNQGPPLTNSFEYNPNARPNQLILIQSAATDFNTLLPVGIKWEEIILPTPSPTPTNTNTPTNTATQTNTPSVTPTNTETPTNTPTNTPTPSVSPSLTPTNTGTPTQTPTPTFAFDSDALNYINTLVTSGATLTFTEKTYINNFYVNAKAQGVYSYFGDFYPMLGGTSSTHSINAKSPGTYNLTFFGGWTHNSSGATPNGTNAYANTIQDSAIYPNALGLTGYYVGSSYSGGSGQYIFSNRISASAPVLSYRQQRAGATGNILGYGFRNGVERPNGTGNLNYMLGYQQSMRTSGDTISYYAQANLILSGTSVASTAGSSSAYVEIARDGTTNYGVGRCQFANISSWSTTSPTSGQLTIMNTLVNQLQSDFGRSVI